MRKVQFTPLGHGSRDVSRTDTTTGSAYTFYASAIPHDSLAERVTCVIHLLHDGQGTFSVQWSTEPQRYNLIFMTDAAHVDVQVDTLHVMYDGHVQRRVVSTGRDTRRGILTSFWRALEALVHTPTFSESWRHPFACTDLERLTMDMRQRPNNPV